MSETPASGQDRAVTGGREKGGREDAAMSVRHAAVWAMAGQYVSFAVQFVTSVIISRFFLAPADVGLFSIALALAVIVAVMQDFGLSRYVSGLPVIGPEDVARCSSVALLFSLVVAGLIALAAVPAAQVYHQPLLRPMLLIIAGNYLLMPLAVMPLALMSRTISFHGHFAVNVGGAAVQGGVALLLASHGYGSLSLAWATLANGAARGLIAQILRPALPWPLRLDGIRPIVGTGSRLSLLYVSGAVGSRSPDMIVGRFLPLLSVGLYSRAVSLSDQFRMLVAGAIGSVFFPAFARIRDRGEALGPPYLQVAAGYTAVLWPGMAGLALAAGPIVRLLYGPLWAGTAPVLQIIALVEVILCALPMHIDIPILMGRLNRLLLLNFADTVLSVGLLAAGCHWGLTGAAVSRLVYAVGWMALYAGFIQRLVRFDVRRMLAIYLRSAAVTVAALAPLALVLTCWVPAERITLIELALAAGAGVAAWFGALRLVGHPAWADVLGIVTVVLRRRS